MTDPAPVDIDLDMIACPGDGWRRLDGRDGEVWIHEEEQRVIVIPTDGPPSWWGLIL